MKKIFPFLSMLCATCLLHAQQDDGVLGDKIYDPEIRTVQFYVDPLLLSDPVISLRGPAQLHLAFDDLAAGKKDYYYTVVLCNYDWTPSELTGFDYLSGFDEQEIRDYKFSSGTQQSYTHYSALFPNQDFRITKSGNYVVKVFEDDDPDQVVLTRRFMVADNLVTIESDVKQADDVRLDRTYQQVNFIVNHKGVDIANAFSDVKILLMQNFRWDNAITNLTPQFVRPEQLDFMHSSQTDFPAGKEFRYFDTRSIRYRTDRVSKITESHDSVIVTLFPDQSRENAQAFSRKDINGKFIPGIQEQADQDAEPDYVYVKLSLPVDYTFSKGRIYVVGAFNDWQKNAPMKYNDADHAYETTLYLKQGYYEYAYYFEGKDDADKGTTLIEGNNFETENSYQILVYYRPFGSRYDQIIGYKTTDTFNK